MMLINKYKPRKIEEIKGNSKNIKRIVDFVKDFKREKKKAVLISGPSGTGKTELAYVLSNKFNLELLELNASDTRNAEAMDSVLGNALKQKSLFFEGKLILIDDIDALSGVQDRGSLTVLIKLIENSFFPIILTCNEHNIERLDSLRKKCLLVEFDKLPVEDVFSLLKEVCVKEGYSYNDSDLRKLSRYSQGDARAALVDLQSCVNENKVDIDFFEPRVLKEDIQNMLVKLFKGGSFSSALQSFDNVKAPIYNFGYNGLVFFGSDDICIYWIEENLTKEFSSKSLRNAYDLISLSDVFYGRIVRRQHWRFLVYCNSLLAALAIVEKKNNGIVKYVPSSRNPKNNFKLWSLVNRKSSVIAEKIGSRTHSSKKIVNNEILPYLRIISRNGVNFSEDLGLSEEEIIWLKT